MWRVAQAMWWLRFLLILRLSQPSLAGVGAGAELGNMNIVNDQKVFVNLEYIIHNQLKSSCK